MKRLVIGLSLLVFMFVLSACGLFGGTDDIRDGRGGRIPQNDTVWHTITFDSQGGSAVDAFVVAEGTPFTLSQIPTRRGYTFTGWYRDEGLSDDFSGAEGLTESVTLYAGWSLNTYNILFFDGESLVYSGAYAYDAMINYPDAPSRIGRLFSHWAQETQVFNRSRMPDEHVQLQAVFTPREYLIHFSTNVPQEAFDGFLLGDLPYTIDDLPSEPEVVPHIEGWTFVGFYLEGETDEPFDFSQPPFLETDDIIRVEVRYELDES